MKIGPIQKSSVAGKVFETLYEMIASGQFRPGERLPSQDELSVRFGVSRNTLREAIHKLSAMGLVLAEQGVGTVVQPARALSFLDSLDGQLLADPLSLKEFMEARIQIEKVVVRLAVNRSGPGEVRKLENMLASQKKAAETGEVASFIPEDVAFHMELARMSGNRVLLKFLQTIWGMLHQFIAEVSAFPGAIEDAVRFHTGIYSAMAAGDADRAEQEMLSHLLDVVRRVERNTHADLDAEALFGRDFVRSTESRQDKNTTRRSKER